MPGAGSIKAANQLFAASPKDGTVFGTFGRGLPYTELIGDPAAQFKSAQFNWIGSMNDEVSICVLSDDFDGPWVQVYGNAEVLDMPEAAEPFVEYFRSIAGEHPDWDEYKKAMADQGKSLIRITPTSWGPVATGGFPPEVAERMG